MTNTDDTKQAVSHTPEPWQIHRLNNGWPVITSAAHDIADLRLNGNGRPHVEANARRICAAVNACPGLSTEALERGIVFVLLEALEAQDMAEQTGWATARTSASSGSCCTKRYVASHAKPGNGNDAALGCHTYSGCPCPGRQK
jgi:hypothetical protein